MRSMRRDGGATGRNGDEAVGLLALASALNILAEQLCEFGYLSSQAHDLISHPVETPDLVWLRRWLDRLE